MMQPPLPFRRLEKPWNGGVEVSVGEFGGSYLSCEIEGSFRWHSVRSRELAVADAGIAALKCFLGHRIWVDQVPIYAPRPSLVPSSDSGFSKRDEAGGMPPRHVP